MKHELPSSSWTNYGYIDLIPEGDLNDCFVICDATIGKSYFSSKIYHQMAILTYVSAAFAIF